MSEIDKNNEIKLKEKHISVLLNELVESIDIFEDKQNIIVDTTLWMAWHAKKIIEKMNNWDIFIWFDADSRNLVLATEILKNTFKEKINIVSENNYSKKEINIVLINSNFVNLQEELENRNIKNITWIYYDLWISSLHVDEAERWFSFMREWPLDMRFDNTKWITAAQIVNSYTAADLRKIFIEYWEEPASNKISAKIVEIRKEKKFITTKDLSDFLDNVAWYPKTKTRVFQALRIETNNELKNIEKSFSQAINLLEKDWKIFVISFHSLEDRITKQTLKKETKDCICRDIICTCHHKKQLKLMTKKPILPTEEEIKLNPRSRSAKARCAQKII